MNKFRVKDKHRAFVNDVAAGIPQYKAYRTHISKTKNPQKNSVEAAACALIKRPEMQSLLKEASAARSTEIIKVAAREVAKEFTTPVLTVEELDSFHSAVVQGLIMVEETIPVYKWAEILGEDGKVKKRVKEANFVRVTRPPNVREKQVSVDALFKRFGNYAPSRVFGAFGKVNDDGEVENIERVVLLSDGTKVPL